MSLRIGRTFLNGVNSFKNLFKRGMDKWVGFPVFSSVLAEAAPRSIKIKIHGNLEGL
jgi:hypothetical protein